MKQTKKLALTGMLCALAAGIMMLGNLIPLATFCCPALAGLMLGITPPVTSPPPAAAPVAVPVPAQQPDENAVEAQ